MIKPRFPRPLDLLAVTFLAVCFLFLGNNLVIRLTGSDEQQTNKYDGSESDSETRVTTPHNVTSGAANQSALLSSPPTIDVPEDKASVPSCDFKLSVGLNCSNRATGTPRGSMRGTFWVLYNYIRAEKFFNCNESITYTTHADHRFMDNLEPLLERWQGPVSVGVYAPGDDYYTAVETIFYYRQCSTSSRIRDFVTFHLFFDQNHAPKSRVWNQTVLASYQVDCENIRIDELLSSSYKTENKLDYPVNVARNIARETANTYFVFPSDIELYPNPGVIPAFLDMIRRNGPLIQDQTRRRIFVSAIFEIDKGHPLPVNKKELVELLDKKVVIPFHQRVCPTCHNIPNSQKWTEKYDEPLMETFHVAKREGRFHHWEPIYVGTHADPLYDERLTWDGRGDKMTQGFLFCALDYDFHVLNNAFLIHKPGIKSQKEAAGSKDMAKVTKQTNLILKEILPNLRRIVGEKKGKKCTF